MKDWYDKGEGSEHMKREIALSARENPVSNALCIFCEHKKKRKRRKRVGIIIEDCMGGDASYKIVSEKDYKAVLAFHPTMIWMKGTEREQEVFDGDKYQRMLVEYFYDKEKEDDNEKVLKSWSTQTFVPEKINLSEYNIVGILTLPGG